VHESSYEKMRAFCTAYVKAGSSVLDVGSGGEVDILSYRPLFDDCEYVGLDIEPGHNVDLVPADPFAWPEIETDSFDVVISGQTFEHNPYFWITAAEIARVLRPGGLVAVIAPSKGMVHRYPLDCWRFYPDSWSAICRYVGLELLEGFTEPSSWRLAIPGIYWGDAMMVGRKPLLAEGDEYAAFHKRLDAIVMTRTEMPDQSKGPGPAGSEYASTHVLAVGIMASHPLMVLKRLNPHPRQRWPFNAIRRRAVKRNGRLALERGARRLH
jgi:SAM-dependent methyltransferase